MTRLALLLALVAGAACAWLAVEVASLRGDLDQQRALLETAGRAAPARADGHRPEPAIVLRDAGGPAASGGAAAGDGAAAPGLAGRPEDPGTLAERVEAMERRIAAQEEAVTTLREQGPGGRRVALPAGRFLFDADSAARELKLDDRQKEGLERVLADSRRELEELRNTPNAEGVTWKDASRIKFEGSADGAMISFGGNFEKLEAFKKSVVPGRSETYGEAEQRIRRRAKDDVRRLLTPEQQKTFDESVTDPLFGPGMGGGFAVASMSVTTTDEK